MTQAILTPAADIGAAPGPDTVAQPRKVFVKTYGCQMNVYDSERMSDALTRGGYQAVDSVEAADLVDWLARATTRHDALAALDEISTATGN